jgi:monodictyphenone polyketide synthase
VGLPVYGGLCHAKHEQDARDITTTSSIGFVDRKYKPEIPIFQTSTGHQFAASTARDLLEQITLELLTRPIVWDRVVQSLVEQAYTISAISVFHNSIPVNDLRTALKSKLQGFEVSTKELIP